MAPGKLCVLVRGCAQGNARYSKETATRGPDALSDFLAGRCGRTHDMQVCGGSDPGLQRSGCVHRQRVPLICKNRSALVCWRLSLPWKPCIRHVRGARPMLTKPGHASVAASTDLSPESEPRPPCPRLGGARVVGTATPMHSIASGAGVIEAGSGSTSCWEARAAGAVSSKLRVESARELGQVFGFASRAGPGLGCTANGTGGTRKSAGRRAQPFRDTRCACLSSTNHAAETPREGREWGVGPSERPDEGGGVDENDHASDHRAAVRVVARVVFSAIRHDYHDANCSARALPQ
eukprot:3738980-Rhodomonas_salina.1